MMCYCKQRFSFHYSGWINMKFRTAILISSVLSIAAFSSVQAADWQALPDKAPAPADNPTTAAKVELGKMLYMDPRFSSTGTVSCNSCHNIMEGGDDSRSVSMGVHGKTGGRNAPTVWNSRPVRDRPFLRTQSFQHSASRRANRSKCG